MTIELVAKDLIFGNYEQIGRKSHGIRNGKSSVLLLSEGEFVVKRQLLLDMPPPTPEIIWHAE